MSLQRVCLPCRDAKARCDRARPACGRCVQRGMVCSGYRDEQNLVFLDQNEIARRNSRRARGEASESVAVPLRLVPGLAFRPPSPMNVDSPSSPLAGESSPGDVDDVDEFYWLNREARRELPEPIRRDLETRAIERFFVNWVIHPCNHGVSPGHLQDLPVLYKGAHSESVVRSAVEALAYAELGDKRDSNDRPFHVRARMAYGAALTRMRTVAGDEQRVSNDRVLVALLLIDNFEMMHLGRSEPLGVHSEVVRHVLTSRGDEQLYSSHSFALWRIAHHRLQARQILLREGPDRMQELWISKLNTARPDIHISADVLHMNILCGAVRKLVESQDNDPTELIQRSEGLIASIHGLLASIETWTYEVAPRWRSVEVDRTHLSRPRYIDPDEAARLLPDGPIRTFHDKWLAYMWNFHMASQIVLRESLIELQESSIDDRPAEDDERAADIELQKANVRRLSATIVSLLPSLLGFTDDQTEEALPPQVGNMAGRFFCLYSMWVIQRARYTVPEEKHLANQVTDWIKESNALT